MNTPIRFWVMVALLVAAAMVFHFVSHAEEPPASRPFSEFPLVLGSWEGREVPVRERILEVLGVDDYLNRVYRDAEGSLVYFYVGYYQSQRHGKTIHSPKSCLPGAGWYNVRSDKIQITRPDGSQAEVILSLFQKGIDRHVIVYWYQMHGRIIDSEYWGKVYLVLDAMRLNRTDGALVHIRLPVRERESEQETIEQARRFAEAALVALEGFIPS